MIGSRLGHHEITAKLGEGGMGEVYRATDTRLDREIAEPLEILGGSGGDPGPARARARGDAADPPVERP